MTMCFFQTTTQTDPCKLWQGSHLVTVSKVTSKVWMNSLQIYYTHFAWILAQN